MRNTYFEIASPKYASCLAVNCKSYGRRKCVYDNVQLDKFTITQWWSLRRASHGKVLLVGKMCFRMYVRQIIVANICMPYHSWNDWTAISKLKCWKLKWLKTSNSLRLSSLDRTNCTTNQKKFVLNVSLSRNKYISISLPIVRFS